MKKTKGGCGVDKKETLAAALRAAAEFYRQSGRPLPWRRDREPYHVFLSEIMLQQTRVEAVIPYYEKFLRLFPTVEALAATDEDALLKAWEGLGYYSRARNLRRAAERVVAVYGGRFPASYDELLSLPGVGKYTAGAIASISFGLPRSAVDGNALRIYTRLFADGTNTSDEAFKARVTEELDAAYPTGDDAACATQGLMEVGQCFCLPNGAPKCKGCPLSPLCEVGRGNADHHLYPNKEKRRPRRVLKKTVLLITDGEGFYIQKRPDSGLLAGLWEFPSADGHLSSDGAMAAANALGFSAQGVLTAVDGKHIFTHLEWHMKGYLVSVSKSSTAGFIRATPEDMEEKYAIPTAFRTFLDYIKENQR